MDLRTWAWAVVLLVLGGTPAHAQLSTGFRLGLSEGHPSQLFFGVHVETKTFAAVQARLHADAGLGTERSAEFGGLLAVHLTPVRNAGWAPYIAFGGESMVASGGASAPKHWGGGPLVAGGVDFGRSFYVQLAVCVAGDDKPSPRFTVGFITRQ